MALESLVEQSLSASYVFEMMAPDSLAYKVEKEEFKIFPTARAAGVNQADKQQQPNKEKSMALNIKPLGDRITLVEAVEEKETKRGGIIIPDSAKEKPTESIVVALGAGARRMTTARRISFGESKKGDRILCSKYGGTEIKIDGKEYKILSSDDILAVLE